MTILCQEIFQVQGSMPILYSEKNVLQNHIGMFGMKIHMNF